MHALTITPWLQNPAIRRIQLEFKRWNREMIWSMYRRAQRESTDRVVDISLAHRIIEAPTEIILLLFDLLEPLNKSVPRDLLFAAIGAFSGCTLKEKVRFIICSHNNTGTGKLTRTEFTTMLDNLRLFFVRIFGQKEFGAWICTIPVQNEHLSEDVLLSYDEVLKMFEPFQQQYEALPWSRVSRMENFSEDGIMTRFGNNIIERFQKIYEHQRIPHLVSISHTRSEPETGNNTGYSEKPVPFDDQNTCAEQIIIHESNQSLEEPSIQSGSRNQVIGFSPFIIESHLQQAESFTNQVFSVVKSDFICLTYDPAVMQLSTLEQFGDELTVPSATEMVHLVQV
jgi:hypothetical protein